jgi:hypothetical protein
MSRELAPHTTLIFLHVPKTGGQTLDKILRRIYGKEGVYHAHGNPPDAAIDGYRALPDKEKRSYRVISGHVALDMHEAVPDAWTYVALVREPIRRVVSTYHYIRRHDTHPLHAALTRPGMTLEKAVESGIDIMMNNGQTRALTYKLDPPYGSNDRTMLDAALHAIDTQFSVVGLTEQFDETLILLRKLFAWPMVYYSRRNVAPGQQTNGEFPKSTLDVIRAHNQLDIELYAHVKKRFEAAQSGASFRTKVILYTMLNGARNRSQNLASIINSRRR